MGLEGVLKQAVARIRSGALENEAQVKQAVILPVLRELGWIDSDPTEFLPEYSTGTGRVDYALLGGGGPRVFIEAKALGKVDVKGEEQVFGYAVNRGVPFLILTDGNLWDFYLSMAEGPPAERRFYRVELTRQERVPEYVESLEQFLRKDRVVSGAARRTAERRHESNQERMKARKVIPDAWRDLLSTSDSFLHELLAEEVESRCGTKPEPEDVEKFLKERLFDVASQKPASSPTPPRSRPRRSPKVEKGSVEPRSKPRQNAQSKITGFVLDGERVETGVAIKALVEVIKAFDRRDQEFMERLAERAVGRTRHLVARKRNDLFSERPDLVKLHSINLGNGWWLGGNLSTDSIRDKIRIACEVAGVKFGSQLQLIEL